MNNNVVLFALLFLLLNKNVIDITQLLIFLSLISYSLGWGNVTPNNNFCNCN
ncbi:MAG: hypothetical protein J6B16_01025 [Clostridia bacterium]|nr:hypothetical protein [Clostridia bacterium]